ncbi:calcium-dependent lipid-binding family protein [Striga asiatica]|uniref:Calcium-dependent lipid-binding family protein n=1 Tax=Striga asiatica TaxID=4170 RepID=A0A5A7R3G4_STRAF|nr:calcium-dependent lipid-binding family protein [Striga asiatica]
MENRNLDVTLQYARDLSNVNLISKMEVYAVVSISGGDKSAKQQTKSPPDRRGGSNPTWNFPMKFALDEAALQANRLSLDFKLVCERALGDKDVGEVHVPIKELLDSPARADGKQFVSYQVRKPSGRPKGQLTFSYQFGGKTAGPPPYGSAYPGKVDSEPVMAYPAGSSSVYPPYPAVEGKEQYPPPPVGYGYPPPPPPSGYGYPPPPPPPGYGYQPPPPPVQQPARKKKNNFGLGLGAGLLGGLLVGDMISDASDFDCGGFDF